MLRKRVKKSVEVAERRERAARLYISGSTMCEIAKQLDVNVGTISRDIAAVREKWVQRAQSDYSEHVAMELAKLDAVEVEAWAGWQRSQKGDQVGSPSFLAEIRRCIEARSKLLGLEIQKHEIKNTTEVLDVPELDDDYVEYLRQKACEEDSAVMDQECKALEARAIQQPA